MSYRNDIKMLVSNVCRIEEIFTDEERMYKAIDEDCLYHSDFYNHISKHKKELNVLLRENHRITSRLTNEVEEILE